MQVDPYDWQFYPQGCDCLLPGLVHVCICQRVILIITTNLNRSIGCFGLVAFGLATGFIGCAALHLVCRNTLAAGWHLEPLGA
jgi:hypothetical protein